jgi:hypothetical protein
MSLNENIHYTKIVDLDNIYNFVVQIFFIWNNLSAQIIDITLRSKIQNFRSKYVLIIWA